MPRKSISEIARTKQCTKCLRTRPLSKDFYISHSSLHGDGRIPLCKECLRAMFDEKFNGTNAHETIDDIVKQIDRPYLSHIVDTSIESSVNKTEKTDHVFLIYMKNIAMGNYAGMTYKDSSFPTTEENKSQTSHITQKPQVTNYDLNQLKSKYGFGYPDEEYYLFEDKYQQLKTSFQLLTTMHEEYFREFCVNKVKETLAKAKGNFKEAKEWAAMVKDVAEAGKLKPSQMSKSDLSGGLDTFGQLVRMVEENYEIMPLLPKFIEKPKDKVDVTLWCFINYVRDLKGLPECEYKEIYDFYRRKKEDYESQMSDGALHSESEEED